MDLSSIDVAAAAEHLAARHAVGTELHEKHANVAKTVGDMAAPFVRSLGTGARSLSSNLAAGATPGWEAARNALIGAGIGGTLGVGRSILSDERDKDPLGDMLTGGLLGGSLGGAGTLLYRNVGKFAPELVGEKSPGDLLQDHKEVVRQSTIAPSPELAARKAEIEKMLQGRNVEIPNVSFTSPAAAHVAGGIGEYDDAAKRLMSDNPGTTAGTLGGYVAGSRGMRYLQDANAGRMMQSHVAGPDFNPPNKTTAAAGAAIGKTPPQTAYGPQSRRLGLPRALGGSGLLRPDAGKVFPGSGVSQAHFDAIRRQAMRARGARATRMGGGIAGATIGNLLGRLLDE